MNTSPLALKNIVAIGSIIIGGLAFCTNAVAGDTHPQFSVQSNATRAIRSSVNAFHAGKFDKSVAYSRYALKQGLKKSRRSVAYSNLCAAQGVQGHFDKAMEACNQALEVDPANWQALSNRAAVHWLMDNKANAKTDILAAKALNADAPEIRKNIKIFG